jgi:hypothetical protein
MMDDDNFDYKFEDCIKFGLGFYLLPERTRTAQFRPIAEAFKKSMGRVLALGMAPFDLVWTAGQVARAICNAQAKFGLQIGICYFSHGL